MNRPILEPAITSDETIFKNHVDKVRFVNPPGSELYASIHPHGRRADPYGNFFRDERNKRRDIDHENLTIKGRPAT